MRLRSVCVCVFRRVPSHRARRPLPSNAMWMRMQDEKRFQPTLLHIYIYTVFICDYTIHFYIF